MSDILIRSMKMPKEGDLIVIRPDGKAYYVSANPQNAYERKAILVPPHGRLKDYDSVMEQYSKWFHDTENREYENMFYMLQNELRGAPTIIPAEEN